ncbi:hypothetical protein [Xylanimonas ulmi]|uniref:Pilus assembly protein Flp/PilA n=1 Tax=Xylanimonas ulmi TaxID=228973 RepID=A0A4Q7M8Q1_9MICO|nr:hypothetical protein [Xylanibacterium ulmi]RZS63088.1 hypothetical protein EV386_3446 [Xylanibacterium ulmi]
MSKIAQQATAAKIAMTAYVVGAIDRIRSDERGQGSVEYVGIIVVVAAILVIIIGAASGIGETLVDKITEQIDLLHD